MQDFHQPTRGMLHCDQCHRSFTRPSHLNRHRLTHVPHSQRRIIQCSYCDRSFSRQDVLLRHLRATHDIEGGHHGSSQRSCNRCVRHKLKCDRAIPCSSCQSSKIPSVCSYPFTPSLQGAESAGAQDLDQSHLSQTSAACSQFMDVDQQQFDGRESKGLKPCAFHAPQTEDFPNFDQGFGAVVLEDGCTSAFDSGNTPSDGNATASSNSLDGSLPFDFRASGFDWLDFDISNIQLPINGEGNLEEDNQPPSAVAYMNSPSPTNLTLPTLPALPSRPNGLPWPFEQGKDFKPSQLLLPRLQDVLQKTSQPSPAGESQTPTDCLIRLLLQQQLPNAKQIATSNLTPGLELMNQLIDSFFTGFQIIQPIFHVPTWTVRECPTTLLAAMACVGSVLSTDAGLSDVSDAIGEFCASVITWLGISDSSNYSNISYLAALCLHQIYSLGSGNRHLYQNADRTRGVLIASLRGLGLLNARLNIQEDTHETSNNDAAVINQSNANAEWMLWVARERENRIAWASFEYDCSLCTLTNRRAAVDLSELPTRLPCSESLWETSSAHAWAALKCRCPAKAQGARLPLVLSAAMAGKPLGDQVSMWGIRLCGQIIGRLLWDLKQLETLSTSQYFNLPSLFKGHQHSKSSLLRGLDALLQFMEQPCSTADLVSYNISSLLCHYSHMYAADDIMDMILYIVRKTVSHVPGTDNGLVIARRRLSSTLKTDRKQTRRLLWHAGQIVAVANEYLVSAPCEIMRLFMAYIFIVAYIKYSPSSLRPTQGNRVRLDVNCRNPGQKKAITHWIQNGGPAQIGSANDIFEEGSTVLITRDAQSTFQQLRSWGLAEKFAKILQSFENHSV